MKKLDDDIARDIFYHWMKCFWKENSVTVGLVDYLAELGLAIKDSVYYIVDEKKFTLEMLKNDGFDPKLRKAQVWFGSAKSELTKEV